MLHAGNLCETNSACKIILVSASSWSLFKADISIVVSVVQTLFFQDTMYFAFSVLAN